MRILKLRFPDKSEEELSEFLDKQIKKNLKNTDCKFVNNYTNKTVNLNLLRFTEWYFDKNPISTEHGVFFKKQDQAINLPAKMLEHILNSRKANKKKMFQAEKAGNKELTKFYNTRQKVDKIFANSYYGVSGQSASVFYNLFVALSITGKGQSIISTAMTTFERFLANNILFRSIDDCLYFVSTIVNDETITLDDSENLDKDITLEKVRDYLLSKFYNPRSSKKYTDTLGAVLSQLDQPTLNRIYYKNNLFAFFSNKKIFQILEDIIGSCDEFKNPGEVPESIKPYLDDLWNRVKEYVFFNHPVHNRINTLKTIKRKAVIVVDTDSNFLNIEPFYKYVQKKASFEVDDTDLQMTYKIVNIMAFMLSNVIADSYWKYTGDCNVPESHRPIIAMKNEFLMSRVLLTSRKKNYASVVLLQEGVEKNPPELDIKGLSIKKSNVNRNTGKFLQDILEKDILSSPTINSSEILSKLEGFENSVRNSFNKGEITYMTPSKANDISSYKAPFTQATIRAGLAWNAVHPNNPITFPAPVNLVKINADSIDKIASIYDEHKDVYKALKTEVFDHPDLGKYGLTYWAMPKNVDKLPDWIIPFVDTETIIQDNLKNFLPILNSIGIKTINIKADELFFSNIVDF